MGDVSERCVLLKGFPPALSKEEILDSINQSVGNFCFHNKFQDIECHVERADDKRWIILFHSKQDAYECNKVGVFEFSTSHGNCTVVSDLCSECIIPERFIIIQKQEEFDLLEDFEEEPLDLMPHSTQPVDNHKEVLGDLNKKSTAAEKVDLESKYYVVTSMDLASGSQGNAEPLTKLASDSKYMTKPLTNLASGSKDTTKPLYKSSNILNSFRGHCLYSEAELEGLQKTNNIDSEAGLVAALEGLTLVTSENSGKLSEQCTDSSVSTVDLFKDEIDRPGDIDSRSHGEFNGHMENTKNKPEIEPVPKTNLDKLKEYPFNDFASSILFGSGQRTKTNEMEVGAEPKTKTNDSETEVGDNRLSVYNNHVHTNDTKPENMSAPVQPLSHQMFGPYYGNNMYPFGVCPPHPHASFANAFQSATEQQQNVMPSLPNVPYYQQYNIPPTCFILPPTPYIAPLTQNNVSPAQNNVPQIQNSVPQTQNSVQQTQINVPQTQSNVPQTQKNVPPTPYILPPAQNNVPQTQNIVPAAQINVLQTQNNVPPAQINVPQIHYNVPPAQINVPQTHYNIPQTHYNALQAHNNAPQTHYNVSQTNYNVPQTYYKMPLTSPPYIMTPQGYFPYWDHFYQFQFMPNGNSNMYYASPEGYGPWQNNNFKLNKNTWDVNQGQGQSQGQITEKMKQQSETSQPSKANNRNKKVEELEAPSSCEMFGYSKNFEDEEDSEENAYTRLAYTEEPVYDKIQSDTKEESLRIFTNVDENDFEKNKDLHQENVSTETQQKMIHVNGLTRMPSKEALEMFFENKKRSGGGPIKALEINVHKKEALIEFCEHSDAASVVKKCKSDGCFKVFECELNAVMYTPPPVDPCRIFIKNIHVKTSQECLENFVEARCRSTPVEVIYGDTPGTAMVTFSQPLENLKNIKMEFGKRTCDGQLLEMMEVEETKSVKVQCQQSISSQALTLYLENVRQSNGGDVDKVDVHEQANTYIATFVKTSDALRVCQKKDHILDSSILKVSLYHACLDMDPSSLVTIPAPLTFDDLDPHLVKFLCNSAVYRNKLEDEIAKCYGKIVWPSRSSEILRVACMVDKGDKDGRNKVKSWDMCTSIIDEVCQEILVNRDLNIAHENWLETLTKLKEVSVKNEELVMVFLEKADNSIIIVGQTGHCEDLTKQIQKIVTDIEQKLDEENHVVTKQKRIKMYEILLLRACRFDAAMQKKGVEVTMNKESKVITFKGIQRAVNSVMQEMRDQLNNFVKRKIPGLSELAKNLLYDTETCSYVKKKLSEKKIIGVWDRIRGQGMFMYSKSEDNVETAINIVKESIKDTSIPLNLNMVQFITSEECKTAINGIQEKYKGFMRMEINKDEILLAIIDHKENEIRDVILKYLDEQSVVTDVLEPDLGRFDYLMTYQKHQFTSLEEQLKNLNVTIHTSKSHFQIHGKKEGYKTAVKLLQKLLDGIHQKEHMVSWPGFSKFLQSPIGKDVIQSIENSEKCICKVSYLSGWKHAQSEISCPKQCAMFQIGTCELVVYHGNVLSVNVDAIVNPSWSNLTHSLGLGKEIVDKGGFSIQKECNEYLREQHFMKEGSIFISKAGKLAFHGILHVVIPQWRGGEIEEDSILASAIRNCLKAAEQEGFYRVAFPTLGAGTFKFPPQKAVQILVKSINAYLSENTYSKLTSIAICEIKENILDFVVDVCYKVFVKPVHNSEYTMQTRSSTRNNMNTTKIIQTKIVISSLVTQNVDVIVNSTNQYIDLSVGMVSKILLAAAGDGLQDECKLKYPNGINVGQIAVTSGHKLSCKNVFHVMIPKWSQGQGYCTKVMAEFIEKCLIMVDTYKFNSIAFPALGTGILGYPSDVVANLFYSVINAYQTTNPNTNLRLICLVLWAGDSYAIKAFHDAESRLSHHSNEKHHSVEHSDYNYQPFKQTVTLKDQNRMVGPVTLTVCQNDITKEKTEAIVNSTTKDFNLATGIVSNTILKEAGMAIQAECNAQGKGKKMCVTSAGKLNCQKIIHLCARNSASKWQASIVMCLNEVENLGFSSVSFPALGTGGKAMNPETIAKTFVSAILEYTESKQFRKCLKTVRIVIYETEMVPVFEKAVQAVLDPSSLRKARLQDLKFWKKPNEKDQVSIHIYTDSAHHAERVVRKLENMKVTEEILLTRMVKDRIDRKMQEFKDAGQDRIVKVKKVADRIVLTGYAKSCVTEVKTFIDKYLDKLHKEITLSKISSSVTLPHAWSKMALTDPLKIDVLQSTDADFLRVSAKFKLEAGGFNIIKIERIQNPALYMQYIGKKREMEQKNYKRNIEQMLWHGTKGDAVANINSTGFNRNYNTGSSYGVGVYFAVKAAMSASGYSHPDASGNRHIYLAYVLTGDYCVASGPIRVPPAKGANVFDTYDTTCDNVTAPNLFVIYHDAQAYPSFHIVFK